MTKIITNKFIDGRFLSINSFLSILYHKKSPSLCYNVLIETKNVRRESCDIIRILCSWLTWHKTNISNNVPTGYSAFSAWVNEISLQQSGVRRSGVRRQERCWFLSVTTNSSAFQYHYHICLHLHCIIKNWFLVQHGSTWTHMTYLWHSLPWEVIDKDNIKIWGTKKKIEWVNESTYATWNISFCHKLTMNSWDPPPLFLQSNSCFVNTWDK